MLFFLKPKIHYQNMGIYYITYLITTLLSFDPNLVFTFRKYTPE